MPTLKLKLSPAGKTYVNLPTFLWTGNPALITVTATIPGYMSVTVTAQPGQPQIAPGTANATPYTNCGPNGSHYTASSPQVTGAGPGSQPDCGVVYQAPSTAAPLGYTMQVTVPWIVTWTGNGVLPGAPPLQVSRRAAAIGSPSRPTGPLPPCYRLVALSAATCAQRCRRNARGYPAILRFISHYRAGQSVGSAMTVT